MYREAPNEAGYITAADLRVILSAKPPLGVDAIKQERPQAKEGAAPLAGSRQEAQDEGQYSAIADICSLSASEDADLPVCVMVTDLPPNARGMESRVEAPRKIDVLNLRVLDVHVGGVRLTCNTDIRRRRLQLEFDETLNIGLRPDDIWVRYALSF